MDRSRRETFRILSKLAFVGSGIYLLSKLPTVNAQASEIDVGLLQVPVTFDGQVQKDEWYADSIDYKSTAYDIMGVTPAANLPQFQFRGKFDANYTYLAFDIPTSKYFGGSNFLYLLFDTKMSGSSSAGAEGVHNLWLAPSMDTFHETAEPNGPGFNLPGTAFFKAFTKGQDYDWVRYWGPSPQSSDVHLQFEFKFRTSILTKYSNRINFFAVLGFHAGANGSVTSGSGEAELSSNRIPMVFKQQSLPEFDSETALILSSLVGAVAATRLAKKRLSRRDLFRVH